MVAKPDALPALPGMLLIIVLLTWLSLGFWSAVKPLAAGTHVASLAARLAESDIEFIDETMQRGATVRRAISIIERADEMIVVDQSPLPSELTAHLLARKRQRPKLEVIVVTDPRDELYGGTPSITLNTLETAGIIVARTDLGRLRDSNPLYSSLWRLGVGWWSSPYDETPRHSTLLPLLRQLNRKADERSVLVADDGAGGWSSIVASHGGAALVLRRHLARDLAASELAIANWSTNDDRLPGAPPVDNRSLGSIDARFLSEGAVLAAVRATIGMSGSGDEIAMVVGSLADRRIIDALLRAVARGARVQLLLDPYLPANRSVAAELLRAAGVGIEVRWLQSVPAGLLLVRHRADVWLNVGSADYTRRDLDDLNLEAHVELHMPANAAPARAAAATVARQWAAAAAYDAYVDTTPATYWKYRIAEATGLALF